MAFHNPQFGPRWLRAPSSTEQEFTMIAFGNNSSCLVGGETRARSHIDIVLQRANFLCDGGTTIERGEFHSDFMVG